LNVDLGDVGMSYFLFLRRAEGSEATFFVAEMARRQTNGKSSP